MNATAQQPTVIPHISAIETWDALSQNTDAQLIDVRTIPEWSFVGVTDLSSIKKEAILLSWRTYPSMDVNQQFADQLEAAVPAKDTPLYFMCKVGGRSQEAAEFAAANGYTHVYNVVDGFEGDNNGDAHRSMINGWKAGNLPWRQQ